jgi:hypothetical protein
MGGFILIYVMCVMVDGVSYLVNKSKKAAFNVPIETSETDFHGMTFNRKTKIRDMSNDELIQFVKRARSRNEVNFGTKYSCFDSESFNYMDKNRAEVNYLRPFFIPRYNYRVVSRERSSAENNRFRKLLSLYVDKKIDVVQETCMLCIDENGYVISKNGKELIRDRSFRLCSPYMVVSEKYLAKD